MEEFMEPDFGEFDISTETREMLERLAIADRKRQIIIAMRDSLKNNV